MVGRVQPENAPAVAAGSSEIILPEAHLPLDSEAEGYSMLPGPLGQWQRIVWKTATRDSQQVTKKKMHRPYQESLGTVPFLFRI